MNLLSKLNIHNKQDFFRSVNQFIKFGLVGVSNTVISLAIYYLFLYINVELYLIGNTVGFVVSVLNSYYWNNKYVFKKTDKGNVNPLIKTFVSYIFTFLLGTGLLFMLVNYLIISEVLAPIVILFITIPLNFILNKYWAFN